MVDWTEAMQTANGFLSIGMVLLFVVIVVMFVFIITEIRPTTALHLHWIRLLRAGNGLVTKDMVLFITKKPPNYSYRYLLEQASIAFSYRTLPSFKEFITGDMTGYSNDKLLRTVD